MKRKIFVLFLLFVSGFAYGQKHNVKFEKAQFDGDFRKYIGTRISYPASMQQRYVEGDVVVAFRINQSGKIDSIKLEKTPNVQLSNQVIKVLEHTPTSWTATKINAEPVSYWYHVIIEYRLSGSAKEKSSKLYDKAKRNFEKQKNDGALEQINEAIALRPYIEKYYQLRAEIYKATGNDSKAEEDLLQCSKLHQSYFSPIRVTGKAVVKTRVIGTTTKTTRTMQY